MIGGLLPLISSPWSGKRLGGEVVKLQFVEILFFFPFLIQPIFPKVVACFFYNYPREQQDG